MTNELIARVKKYFGLHELVSEKVFKRYGEQAWQFFDPRLLEVLIWLREGIGVPLTCNNWQIGGMYQESGFRANMDSEVKSKTDKGVLYCSAHSRGMGIDLRDVKKRYSAEEMRNWIRKHYDECPYPIRMESGVTWLHVDVCNLGDTLIEFKA